jgi:SAM-dependent methyltransferase
VSANRDGVLFPLDIEHSFLDRVVIRVGRLGPIVCTVCGRVSVATGFTDNVRETGCCRRCGATNRQRQLGRVACIVASAITGERVRSLAQLASTDLAVFNTEASGAVHEQLASMRRYEASEYLGPDHEPGAVVDGRQHQDLRRLSFGDETFDLVLSADVLEHVPDPYDAHREIRRVLRPDGHHVFTVPFHLTLYEDEVRARLGADREPELLAAPVYHGDPVRPEGVLVYTIFSLEMLVRLSELGFFTRMYRLSERRHGIVGSNALVFDALKQA